MAKKRVEVAVADKWNVEAMYASNAIWEVAFSQESSGKAENRWPELAAYRGRLGSDAKTLRAALDLYFSIRRRLEKLYTYAHLRHDEDVADNDHKVAYNKAQTLFHAFSQQTAWMEPEILALPQATLTICMQSADLADYRFFLERLIRQRPHTLDAEKEELLALAAKPLQTSYKAFSAINNADFSFGTVKDSQGNDCELTHAQYGLYMRCNDRTLRENAFKKLHATFNSYENTLAELLQGTVHAHCFEQKARRYPSCVEASLFPKNIDVRVYRALIQSVRERLGSLHRYVALRKELLGVQTLHLWDMYVPLIKDIDVKMSYPEAQAAVIASVHPLGEEYQELLRKGLEGERWVDRYENENKRSGAYSSGCYDSSPYILMNYAGSLHDVFTLAHEAGHSMHSLLSHKHQPYQYGDYSIFVAEVASTFNEELLLQHLLAQTKDPQQRLYLINQKLEDIRTTLFRQTMFAEFELLIHEMAEKEIPLTPTLLKEEFRKLNHDYFGDAVVIDPEVDVEWARIPHFYYNFYVFQYATGISAALALAERVLNGGVKERDEYLGFLKGGYSKYPIDLLESAGVDMTTSAPVASSIAMFDRLLTTFEKELRG